MRTFRNLYALFGGIATVLALALMMGPTGGFPSRPRFQQVKIAQAGTPTTVSAIELESRSTGPDIALFETDAAAANRAWTMSAAGETLGLYAFADDYSTLGTAFVIRRTANVIDSVDFETALISQAATAPRFLINETDAPSDEKLWEIRSTDGTFLITADSDAGTPTTNAITIDRNGTTPSLINLSATDVQINSLPALQTGTFSGGDIIGCSSGGVDFLEGSYQRMGGWVFMRLDTLGSTCTSNSTSFTVSGLGLPAAIIPSGRSETVAIAPHALVDNGASVANSSAYINSSGNIIFRNNNTADGSWTASGSKGFATATNGDFQIVYKIEE